MKKLTFFASCFLCSLALLTACSKSQTDTNADGYEAESTPSLADEGSDSLSEAEQAAQADAAAMEGLSEDIMRSLIFNANALEPSDLSSEFKALCIKFTEQYSKYINIGTIITVGEAPECFNVFKPDIKIIGYNLENGRKVVRAVFDVRERYNNNECSEWFSQMTYQKSQANPQLFAADFIKENGKWVVDDIYTDKSGAPIQTFDIKSASSYKDYVRDRVKNFNAEEWENWEGDI